MRMSRRADRLVASWLLTRRSIAGANVCGWSCPPECATTRRVRTSADGSSVVGSKLRSVQNDATAVPWLLLQATSHDGAGRMSKVSFIQRLHTSGGLAPTTGCDAAHSGQTARVPYSATYAFYEPTPANKTHHAP